MANRIAEVTLPDGDYYMITMQISDSFGGLTAAMLERAKVFGEVAGVPTTILTVDARPSYDDVRSKMIREGRITPRVKIVNLFEDLRSRKARSQRPSAEHRRGPIDPLVDGCRGQAFQPYET